MKGLSLAVALLVASHNATAASYSVDVLRRELAPRVMAIVKHGRNLGLEVRPPGGNAARPFLQKYLASLQEWAAYKDRLSVFIPLDRLKTQVQREVLLLIYTEDVVDERGWHHKVIDDRETLWSLCEWVTGRGTNYKRIMADSRNRLSTAALRSGQRILIPSVLLSKVMKEASTKRPRTPSFSPRPYVEGLQYGSDQAGTYATYRLRKGEALFTSVVVRFTDIRERADILEACKVIAGRSNIENVRDIGAGQLLYIPTSMLSDRYQPEGTAGREGYEATLREAARLRTVRARSRDLSDVVVILDPGHGGSDPGAKHLPAGLYEDEINYDIVCRIREILERETGARVYVTLVDRSTQYRVRSSKKFEHDQDEELNTHPPYKNTGRATVSVNLRWMLANSIYAKELRRGTDSRKIIFTSLHTDSVYNSGVRGAMIYIPGAKLRRGEEVRNDAVYARYSEGRNFNKFTSNFAELRRDEALSRNFAVVLLQELGAKRIKRHDQGDPIRSQIRRTKTVSFVPAVLRNTKVPTKVLIETANLKNPVDQKWLADPWWRQQFAKAYVDALRTFYGVSGRTRTARAK